MGKHCLPFLGIPVTWNDQDRGYYEYIAGYHVSTAGWIKYTEHDTCRELIDKSLLKGGGR